MQSREPSQHADIIKQARLRPREREVLRLLGRTQKTKEIAEAMAGKVAPGTVKVYIQLIRVRMAIATGRNWTAAQLAEFAKEHGYAAN